MTTTKLTEFEVRSINADGDAIDILAQCATFSQALLHVPALTGETVAWVIERHTKYFTRGKADAYVMLAKDGDLNALKAGGWVK